LRGHTSQDFVMMKRKGHQMMFWSTDIWCPYNKNNPDWAVFK